MYIYILATYEYIIFHILLLYLYTNRPKVTSINLINRKIQENDDGNKICFLRLEP